MMTSSSRKTHRTQDKPAQPVIDWGVIEVERLGGLAGYGLAGSHLRSCGQILASELSAAEQQILYALFLQPLPRPTLLYDAFHYELSWHSGEQKMLISEAQTPDVIKNCVHDELLPPGEDAQ